MAKIFILGGSGSGKTTLAESIAARFSIPHHDLDKVGWKNGVDWPAYIDASMTIAAQPDWVAEGNFIIWTDPLLYQADYIIWLEINWPLAARRIVLRHIKKSLRGVNPYPGLNGIKLLFKLLKDTRRYHRARVQADPTVARFARQYLAEHVAENTLADAATLLARWEKCRQEIPWSADFARMYLRKYGEKVILIETKADQARLFERLVF